MNRKTAITIAVLLAPLCAFAQAPEPSPSPDAPIRVEISAGGLMSMGSDAGAKATPTATVFVEAPVADSKNAPRIQAQADLSALPGETLDLNTPETFRSLEFSLRLAQRLGDTLRFSVYAEAGFASRLPGDPAPRDKAPRWAAVGVVFDRGTRGTIAVGLAADQRLDGSYQPAAHVKGSVALWQAPADGSLKGATVSLAGDAILGLNLSNRFPTLTGGRHDVVRVGIKVGIGR